MGLKEDLSTGIAGIINQPWEIRQGSTIPSDDQVSLSGQVVKLDATVFYADLKESSKLATELSQRVAGKIYRAYLYCLARLISHLGGTVTAYDGDRIMGIFIGDYKNTSAATCALNTNYVVSNLLRPKLNEHFKTLSEAAFDISHCVGIDTGSFLAVKAGQRGANDLVWIGRPPNMAARLSEVRHGKYTSFLSSEVFNAIHKSVKYGDNEGNKPMWTELDWTFLGEAVKIYGSTWTWEPSS